MNFFRFYILQKHWTQFSQKYIFQNSHFIRSFLRFYRAICLIFFWNTLIWVPTTQFCGKLKIHFSDTGNLFLERITYAKIITMALEFPWNASRTYKAPMANPKTLFVSVIQYLQFSRDPSEPNSTFLSPLYDSRKGFDKYPVMVRTACHAK